MKRSFIITGLLAIVAIGFMGCTSQQTKTVTSSKIESTIGNEPSGEQPNIESPIIDLSVFDWLDIPEAFKENLSESVRYLSNDEKIYLLYTLSESQSGLETFIENLNRQMEMNSDVFNLSDYYVKFEKTDKFYNFIKYVSYEPTKSHTGGIYPAKNDWEYGSFSMGIPQEADRGGMNAGFVQYDYVKKYNYLKNYPEELLPFIDLAKYIAGKLDYDYQAAYGVACKIRPGQTGAVCDGYADYTINLLIANKDKFKGMTEIYKVNSSKMNHAWVELVFNGRPVYFDPTWFDINEIGTDGYSITLPEKESGFDWEYVTYNQELFNKGFSGLKYAHYLGNDAVKNLAWKK